MSTKIGEDIQMVDLTGQYARLKSEIDKAMAQVIQSGQFINGDPIKSFASDLERYLHVNHVIPCANGTDALQIALMALELNPGDEIILPSFTFISPAEVVALLGLKPVFVDVDTQFFTMKTQALEDAITKKTKAIIPVHLYGQCCNMDELLSIAQKHDLSVIEDTAQALGSYYKSDKVKGFAGTLGQVGCTSFFPSKNLGCFGDGGAIFTNDDEMAVQLRTIVNHGSKTKYYHEQIGVNSRLDSIQAAILNVKLKYLNDFNTARTKAADFYDHALKAIPGLAIPQRFTLSSHIFHQYTLRIKDDRRDDLKNYLASKGIPSMVYYPLPLHQQKAFKDFYNRKLGSLKSSERLSQEVLSLPMHTELTNTQLEYIVGNIQEFFKS